MRRELSKWPADFTAGETEGEISAEAQKKLRELGYGE